MTTTVIVEAHCDADKKEVKVSVTGENHNEHYTLYDGESETFVVYDDLECSVKEVSKHTVSAGSGSV